MKIYCPMCGKENEVELRDSAYRDVSYSDIFECKKCGENLLVRYRRRVEQEGIVDIEIK